MVVVGRRDAGYTLVGMIVIFTVMTMLVAAALPTWSKVIRRDREEELIFRGLQYAEAIRVFQLRNGRYPIRLEELITVRPRCIRRLWKDPMTDGGEWGLIYAQTAAGRRGRGRSPGVAPGQRQQPQVFGGSAPRPLGGERSRRNQPQRPARATAPIIGVHSLSGDEAVKTFFGGDSYSDWRFTVEILPVAAVTPDNLNLARANSGMVGRPFPENLGPAPGTAPVGRGTAPSGSEPRRRNSRSGG